MCLTHPIYCRAWLCQTSPQWRVDKFIQKSGHGSLVFESPETAPCPAPSRPGGPYICALVVFEDKASCLVLLFDLLCTPGLCRTPSGLTGKAPGNCWVCTLFLSQDVCSLKRKKNPIAHDSHGPAVRQPHSVFLRSGTEKWAAPALVSGVTHVKDRHVS